MSLLLETIILLLMAFGIGATLVIVPPGVQGGAELAHILRTERVTVADLLPDESGKFWLIETLLAPLPVACAPPPMTLFPEGQVATTLFEFAELDEVDASTRSSPLTPGAPFGPGCALKTRCCPEQSRRQTRI